MYEALLALRQEGSVRDYRRQLETMVAPLIAVLKQVLEGSFVNGLKPVIQAELRILQPCGLGRMMSLANTLKRRTPG